jgi:hypothetical protein
MSADVKIYTSTFESNTAGYVSAKLFYKKFPDLLLQFPARHMERYLIDRPSVDSARIIAELGAGGTSGSELSFALLFRPEPSIILEKETTQIFALCPGAAHGTTFEWTLPPPFCSDCDKTWRRGTG